MIVYRFVNIGFFRRNLWCIDVNIWYEKTMYDNELHVSH